MPPRACLGSLCFRQPRALTPRFRQGNYTVSLIEGDGIGPEISESVKSIFAAAKAPVAWEPCDVTPVIVDGKTSIPQAAIDSIQKNKVALKGPLAVSLGRCGKEEEAGYRASRARIY
jgi:isocitrate/isopropylmalate dehydrogenase